MLAQRVVAEITEIVFGPMTPYPPHCQVLFVFGGTHPGIWNTAAEDFRSGLARHIVVTGGHNPDRQSHPTWTHGDTPESHVVAMHLRESGVPAEVITKEDRSTNSLENVLFAQSVFDFSQVSSVLAICKSYGAGRQGRTLRKHVPPKTQVFVHSFDTTPAGQQHPVSRDNWMTNEKSRQLVLDQCRKVILYGRMGDIEPVESVSKELESLLGCA